MRGSSGSDDRTHSSGQVVGQWTARGMEPGGREMDDAGAGRAASAMITPNAASERPASGGRVVARAANVAQGRLRFRGHRYRHAGGVWQLAVRQLDACVEVDPP